MKLTDNQLEMTTKRTIMENEQMSIELSYQSRQTEKLLNKNSKWVEPSVCLQRRMEGLSGMEGLSVNLAARLLSVGGEGGLGGLGGESEILIVS